MSTGGSPRWLSREQQAMWRAYLDGTRMFFNALDAQLQQDAGISLTDYELMVRLSEAPGRRMRMRELADQTLATKSGVTRAVARLEALGWVVREAVENDRRGVCAWLSDDGFEVLRTTAPGHVEAVRHWLVDRLTPDQTQCLADIMGDMQTRLQNQDIPDIQPKGNVLLPRSRDVGRTGE